MDTTVPCKGAWVDLSPNCRRSMERTGEWLRGTLVHTDAATAQEVSPQRYPDALTQALRQYCRAGHLGSHRGDRQGGVHFSPTKSVSESSNGSSHGCSSSRAAQAKPDSEGEVGQNRLESPVCLHRSP